MKKTYTDLKLEENLLSLKKAGILLLFMCLSVMGYAQPVNDSPGGAIELTVAEVREYTKYYNTLATNSGVMPAPDCGNYSGGDVWFSAVVPTSGNLRIDAKTNVNPKVVLAVYTGNTGDLELYACSETGASGGVTSRVDLSDVALANQKIYIRLFRFGSTVGGEFRIAAYKNEGSISNDEPLTASFLSSDKVNFEMQTYTTESASGSSDVTLPSCGAYSGGDVWFTADVPASGKLVIETDPGTISPVVVVYKDVAGILIEYACSLDGATDNGGEVIIDDPLMESEPIYIRVFANNQVGGGTFDMAILEPRHDSCSDALLLGDVAELENYTRYTNQYADVLNNGSEATCGTFKGKDIWFLVQVPPNGKMVIDTEKETDSKVIPVVTVYTGSCGSLDQYACNFFGSANPFGAKIEISDDALKGEYVYIRLYGLDDDSGGAFRMAMSQPESLPVELVSFRSEVLDNESVLLRWETATEINNDYFLVEHSLDGKEFTPVAHIAGMGTTNETQVYQYEHEQPYFGENYYRLRQVDFDDAFEYSRMVTAIIKMEEAKVHVYPNPVLASEGMTVRWIGDFGREKTQMMITNMAGMQVFYKEIDVRNERQSFIDLSMLGLDAGMYFLTVNDENALITHQKINLVRD